MNILFDHQIYIRQKYGGISRYFYELSKGLLRSDVDVTNTTCLSNNIYTTNTAYNAKKFLPGVEFRGKVRILKLIDEFYSKLQLKENYDVFHPTYYETYFIKLIKKPFVITFHDLIHEKFSNEFDGLKNDNHMIQGRRMLLNKAAKIIVVSKSTKTDIIEHYSVDPSKIEVIHLACSIKISLTESSNLLGYYILYVGVRVVYKNFLFFIKSIKPLLDKERNLKVVCAGGGKFSYDEKRLLKELGLTHQIIHIEITDDTLSNLYSNAIMFVFPSLYEGFGLPILEAFKCSCPAVLSKTSSLTEVGADAAIYFNPYDSDDILDKVSSVLYNWTLRSQLIKAGLIRETAFSWSNNVQSHIKIYKSLV